MEPEGDRSPSAERLESSSSAGLCLLPPLIGHQVLRILHEAEVESS
jgi:hypothetical protein